MTTTPQWKVRQLKPPSLVARMAGNLKVIVYVTDVSATGTKAASIQSGNTIDFDDTPLVSGSNQDTVSVWRHFLRKIFPCP